MPLSATPPKQILYAQNTQVIQVTGLLDYLTGNFLNAAALTLTLRDENGNEVPECSGIPFTYVAGSNGDYQAIFGDENFDPEIGSGYILVVDGDAGGGSIIHLEFVAVVQSRQM
jgi:hypothetical protein